MAEIKLNKRYKYAGDIFPKLIDIGFDIETATDFLNNIKDADVLEVVRCKDCKKHGSRECIVNRKMDIMGHPTTTKANSFCSYGERRDT